MKKLIVLCTAVLMGLTTVAAAETTPAKKGERLDLTRYRYAQPVLFVERGVEFMIFPDGSFDFNTNYGQQTFNQRPRNRRSSINTTHGAPGRRVHYSSPRNGGVLITHDYDGKVRRIGNIFINYDKYGRIKRAGTVYMKYEKRRGKLRQVGGLRVKYNRWGELIFSSGIVNQSNLNCGICEVTSCDVNHFNDDDQDDWYDDDDDDQYYYRNKKNNKRRKADD